MTTTLATLALANFLLMGALPTFLFRRAGRLTLGWWMTAAPFLFCGRLLAHARRGELAPWIHYGPRSAGVVAALVTIASGVSFLLILGAWQAHRQPPALWHQKDDEPAALVTNGVYARIRHPLYAAYLAALLAALLAVPHPAMVATLIGGWVAMSLTARREEFRLGASPLGHEYGAYMRRTGRFWPRWRQSP